MATDEKTGGENVKSRLFSLDKSERDLVKSTGNREEAYRSGHNEAVLKTVWVQAHGGSNPSASAK